MYDRSRIPFHSAVQPRFNAGCVWATPTLRAACADARLRECLGRHVRGDWGIVSEDDARANECALRAHQTVRSIFAVDPVRPATDTANRVRIVTNRQAGVTMLLLGDEPEVWP